MTDADAAPDPRAPGGKQWFWKMRLTYGVVLALPVLAWLFLFAGLGGRYIVAYRGNDEDGTPIKAGDGIFDWVVLNLPSGLLSVSLSLTCYALWRVLINIKAGGSPFTVADGRYIQRAANDWMSTLVASAFLTMAGIYVYSREHGVLCVPTKSGAVVLTAALGYACMTIMSRAHRVALSHNEQLKDVA
jgi:hypothetical protein